MCPELSESLLNAAVSSKGRQRVSEDRQFTWRDFPVCFLSSYIYSFQLSSLKCDSFIPLFVLSFLYLLRYEFKRKEEKINEPGRNNDGI